MIEGILISLMFETTDLRYPCGETIPVNATIMIESLDPEQNVFVEWPGEQKCWDTQCVTTVITSVMVYPFKHPAGWGESFNVQIDGNQVQFTVDPNLPSVTPGDFILDGVVDVDDLIYSVTDGWDINGNDGLTSVILNWS